MANSVGPDQTAPIEAVCSWSTLFPSILNWSVMLGNYLQQTTSADAFFLGALRVILQLLFPAITLYHLVSSADTFCKQFGPRSGLTKCQA